MKIPRQSNEWEVAKLLRKLTGQAWRASRIVALNETSRDDTNRSRLCLSFNLHADINCINTHEPRTSPIAILDIVRCQRNNLFCISVCCDRFLLIRTMTSPYTAYILRTAANSNSDWQTRSHANRPPSSSAARSTESSIPRYLSAGNSVFIKQ